MFHYFYNHSFFEHRSCLVSLDASSRFCIEGLSKNFEAKQKLFIHFPWVKVQSRESIGADDLLIFMLCGSFGMPLTQKIAEYNRLGQKVSTISGLQTS